jgi:hypothetical protein
MKREGEGRWKERCSLQTYVVRPLLTLPYLPKNQNFLPWGFGGHTLRSWSSVKPYSGHIQPFYSRWCGHQTQLSRLTQLGESGERQGYRAVGDPKPNIWL